MKKIKTILESKYLLCLLILFTILFVLYSINNETLYTPQETCTIKDIKIKDNRIITCDHIMIYYNGNKDFALGDVIKIDFKYELPKVNTNFNMFNYRMYLKSKKIFYISNTNNINLVHHSYNLLYKMKNKITRRINNYSYKDYLYTFILGDTNYIEEDLKLSFQNNGISHLFSVSGMHVSLLSVIILNILNKIKKTNINYYIVILSLFFYAFLTNFTISIMRSVCMFILLYINKKINVNIKILYLYMTCLFLLYNPYYIYNVGFLFSFIITYFLILFSRLINNYHNYFIKLFITSLISYIASIPILINNFWHINLLTPFINIIFIPMISLVIFPLCLISFIIPFFSNILIVLINMFNKLSLFISLYGINISLCQMSIYGFILYYILILIIFFKVQQGDYKYLFLIILLLLIHGNYFNLIPEIHFLDVGQGDAALIRYKYNKTVMIDTGGKINSSYKLSTKLIVPYMESFGIRKIDYLIITHGDYDHMGEAINLVNNFKVEKVIFNCGEYNDLEKELIKILDKKNIKYYSCIKELNIDKNKLYFLQTKEYDNENENSNVIYTEINGYKFMFMGDASTTTEKEILDKYNLSNIDVLKVGHHGSKTSSGEYFISEINPKYSIISVGKNNRYGHPNKEVLDNLYNSKVYRTDEDGSIMFKIKNNKLKIDTCSP